MKTRASIMLLAALLVLGGCFDNANHPGKDSDPSKPSLQMQQPPSESPASQLAPNKDSEN